MAITNRGNIESYSDVAPLIDGLLNLRKSKGYCIILVHHTPKRNPFTPITRNDIAGSSNISNLFDGAIAINKSSYDGDPKSRYIKQIKPTRYSAEVYGQSNVITAKIA